MVAARGNWEVGTAERRVYLFMKRELISKAIGNIADKHIEEAMVEGSATSTVKGGKIKSISGWRKYLPMVACFCLLVVGVGGFAAFKAAHPWEIRIETIEGRRGQTEPLTEIAVIPHWEELTINQQYSSIEWKGMNYSSHSAEIPAERIGELLGEVQAVGYDHYADEERRIGAKVYSVTKLAEECILAVQYEGTDIWYGFSCAYYRPETLGQFTRDMNMYEDVVFDTVHYSYTNGLGQYVSVRFDDVDDAKVHEYLLGSLGAANTYDESALYLESKRILGISVDIPILGIENISLSVCEEGYIKTNILATGKLFYIGEENTQAFVDYVLNECEGYETIYIYEDSGIIDSLFGGEPEVEWMNKLFGGSEEGAASPSVEGVITHSSHGETTQSSQGYNPDEPVSHNMTSPDRPGESSGQ